MAALGRPRVSTRQGARPPVNQIGIADPFNYGVSVNAQNGQVAPWRQFIDIYEDVPELFWPRSIQTLDHMRTDSQLAALLTSVIYGITQLRYIIEPNGARPSLVKEISEDLALPIKGKDDQPIQRMKRRFSHHKFQGQAMLAAIFGHAYFEQNGDIVDGKWRLRKMFNIMPRTIAQINVDDDGSLVNVVQWAGRNVFGGQPRPPFGTAEPIPVDRLTAFIFNQEGYNWHGRSMMRDCFKDYTIKDRLLRVEAINHERAGGIPYGVAPQGATAAEIEDINQMMQQFRIGETAGGAVPFGTEIKIARGTGSEINATIMRYDQAMARRFLLMLANLAQGGQHVGSYALGETFEDFFLVGQRAIAQWYCDVVNEHIIEDIADWNYGEDEEFVPKITWERTTEDSLGTEQLATLVQRGVIIVDDELENAIRYKYQLPKRTSPRPPEVVGPGIPRQPPELPPGQEPSTGTTPAQAPATTQAKGAGDPSGAPSSGSPAKASFFHRLMRKPDVMASDGPVLVTVPNVEILHAGVEYNLSTGKTTFTPEDLQDVVMAANEDPSIPNPRLGIGHVDPRYNDISTFDGEPNFGKATNLRLSENGMAVYADYVGVPKWLADIMPYAFPSRSIEGFWGVESQMGKKWRFVLSACKMLGVQWPGVTVLEDLPMYYGADMPSDVVVDATVMAAAKGGDPNLKLFGKKDETAASANMDDVRRAFYSEYVPEHASEGTLWWWIQAILVDPNELVVEDDENGNLYKIPFSSDTDGAISFGDAEAVRIEYVPDTRDANKAAAAHVAATLAIGRQVLASWSKREESLPTTASGGAMDPKEIRKRLGLPEDASDEQVKDALRELNAAAGVTMEAAPPAVEPPAAGTEPATAPGEPATPPAPAVVEPPAAEVLPVAASGLPAGTVLVDKNQWEQTVAASQEASEFVKKQKEREREGMVAAAIADGRIAPASKEHWTKLLETDPKSGEVLASLAKGLIPVELRGTAAGPGEGDPVAAALSPELVAGWTDQLFPEVRNQRATDAARAAGEPVRRSRVSADAAYRR